jgi:phosphatidylinositol-3-phosphatase
MNRIRNRFGTRRRFHRPLIVAHYGRRVRASRLARRPVLLLITVSALLAIAVGAVTAAPRLEDRAEGPAAAVPEYVPHLRHVIVVVFENKDIGDVVGSGSAPVFGRLLRQGAAITGYHGITHPSLPNYLALVSGSTHGITSDCTSCSVSGPSLGTTLAPGTWKTYAEGLPSVGWTGERAGSYAKKHNPLVYFRGIAEDSPLLRRSIVPLGSFAKDLEANALPRFALVVPDLCHDMHDCSVATGDAWLGRFLAPLLRSSALAQGAIFVVFDEGYGSSNHVPALAVGPAVRAGSVFDRPTDHYGLLRTIEQALDLPHLGRSRDAQAIGGIWRAHPAAPRTRP